MQTPTRWFVSLLAAAAMQAAYGHDLQRREFTFATTADDSTLIPAYDVYVPADYDSVSRRYPVIYFLHGKGSGYRDDINNEVLEAYWNAVNAGSIAQSLIVMIDGQGYVDDQGEEVDTFWADAVSGKRRVQRDIIERVIPAVETNAGTRMRTLASSSTGNAFRAVMGFSMGGFGAAALATRYPEKFSAAIIVDGALQKWEEMIRPLADRGNPNTADEMFGGRDAAAKLNYDVYSPWTRIESTDPLVNAVAAINAQQVRFYLLGGQFGTHPDINPVDNYVWDYADALQRAGVRYTGFNDTAARHRLDELMRPATQPDIESSRLCWTTLQAAWNGAMGVSNAGQDGYLLLPGTVNTTTTGLTLGETVDDSAYAAIVSFNTVAIPANATITSAKLVLTRVTGGTGRVGPLGSLQAHIRRGAFGANSSLAIDDYSAAPTVALPAATFPTGIPAVNGTIEATLTDDARNAISRTGITQFRLKYSGSHAVSTDTAETIVFGSGNHAEFDKRPQLVLTYNTTPLP